MVAGLLADWELSRPALDGVRSTEPEAQAEAEAEAEAKQTQTQTQTQVQLNGSTVSIERQPSDSSARLLPFFGSVRTLP